MSCYSCYLITIIFLCFSAIFADVAILLTTGWKLDSQNLRHREGQVYSYVGIALFIASLILSILQIVLSARYRKTKTLSSKSLSFVAFLSLVNFSTVFFAHSFRETLKIWDVNEKSIAEKITSIKMNNSNTVIFVAISLILNFIIMAMVILVGCFIRPFGTVTIESTADRYVSPPASNVSQISIKKLENA